LILFWPDFLDSKEKRNGGRDSGRNILLLGLGKYWTPRRKRESDAQLQVQFGRWRKRAGVEAVLHGGFPNPPPVQMEDQRDFYIHSLEIVAFHSHGRSFFIFMHMGIHFILLFFF
jgi:hypothetical protein